MFFQNYYQQFHAATIAPAEVFVELDWHSHCPELIDLVPVELPPGSNHKYERLGYPAKW